MQTNKSNKRNRNRKRRNGRNRRQNTLIPSQEGNLVTRINPRFPNDVKMLPIHNRVFRFGLAAAETNFQITPTILLKLLVATQGGSTAAFTIIGSVRLRRFSLYSVPSTNDFGNSTSELTFQWLSNLNTPSNLIVDRGTSTQPACIKVVPPLNSRAGMWYSSSTTDVTAPYFQFSAIANSVMDIDLDYTILNGAGTAITLSSAAANTGVAFLGLNGNNIVPDGGGYIVHE